MEQSMFVLLLGIVLGCVVASGIWAVLWTLTKGGKRQQKDRIDIMRNIAVMCADIDGMLAVRAGSSGAVPEFQSSLSSLLEKIHRNLTLSMPLLDVYYVKYIESLIARYEQALAQALSAEKPAPVVKKAAAPSKIAEKDIAEPHRGEARQTHIEEHGFSLENNFEVTQQYDLEKVKSGTEIPDKKTVIIKKVDVVEPAAKEVEKVSEPVAPIAAARPEKPAVDFSDEIAFEFNHAPIDELKGKIEGAEDIKPEVKMPPEDTGEVDIEEIIKTQAIDIKEESAKTGKQPRHEEHFISGEDVIDKLDSFFGIDAK
jgi:hypothetical protein